MALDPDASGPEGLTTAATVIRSYAKYTWDTVEAFDGVLLNTDDTMKGIRRTMNSAMKLVADLEARLQETKDIIHSIHLTTPSPPYIEDLSDDILSTIMVVAATEESKHCAPFPLPSIKYLHCPEVMMAVSRRWHAVAERSAVMWTCVRIDASHKPSRTKRWLQRSLQAPLQLRWTFSDFGDDQWTHDKHSEQSAIVQPYLRQVTTLHVSAASSLPREFNESIFATISRLPSLREFRIQQRAYAVESDLSTTLVNGSFPGLALLDAQQTRFRWDWHVHNIRILRLQRIATAYLPSWSTFREILTSSASLEELDLHIPSLGGTVDMEGQDLPIFHRLHTIIVRCPPKDICTLLLPVIRAPSLRNLTILQPKVRDGDLFLRPLLLSASKSLKKLDIHGVENLPLALVPFFENGPPLEALVIRDEQLLPEVFEVMLKTLPHCTKLRELRLAASWPRVLKADGLEDMAIRRHQTGCTPLEISGTKIPRDLELGACGVTLTRVDLIK